MRRLLGLDEVEVLRDGKRILGPISWELLPGQRWVVLGPNGAGKTTFLQLLGALIHPTRGNVEILGETLGKVDVFDLRPRIGISSSALNESLPNEELVVDLVLTAAYAIIMIFGMNLERKRCLIFLESESWLKEDLER
jgi:iron complex transport system ATP-binding protein